MTKFNMPLFAAACMVVAGCSHSVPPELADARSAYARAANGPAAQQTPADLHNAHQALQEAENSFKEDGDSRNTRDRAYVAARKARMAEVLASTAEAKQEAAKWKAHSESVEDQALKAARSNLSSARSNLSSTQQQLADERAKREEAEKRAAQAFADLARIAQVEKQSRGTVITLPGGVLFESGKSELLSSAEARLTQVADTLVTSSPDSTMVVEGHTDSQGNDQYNQKLSQSRADSVRSYLVQHGVAPDRITAKGMGEAAPVADNKSVEGRANNRRVEIIVQPTGGAASAGNPSPTPASNSGAATTSPN
jgi:outer membrane protein OmpA-like peptidoglycan-associated protein